MNVPTALQDVRVLELGGGGGFAVPYATRLLADLGAEVVIIEPPGGHPLRASGGSFADDAAVAEAVYDFLTRGKRSVTMALEDPDNDMRAALQHLVETSDVVVDGLGPGRLANLGIADSAVDGVLVHASDWGGSGPYRDRPATGLVLQAAAGWVTTRQEPGLPLVQVGGQMHEWIAGSYIAATVMTARAQARRTGAAVTADFSMFECIHSTLPYTRLMADTNVELGRGQTATTLAPFGVRPCQDGWVGINILTGQQWIDACLLMDLAEFAPLQQEMTLGVGDVDGFERRLLAWLASRTVNEVVDLGQTLRIPVVPVASGSTMTSSPQWLERGFFVPRTSRDGASTLEPGVPWRLAGTPAARDARAPTPGEDDEAFLGLSGAATRRGEHA